MSGEAAMVSCSAGASELAHFPEQTQLRCGPQLYEHSHHPCAGLHPEPHEEDDFATEVRYARTGLDRMFIGENFTESLGPVTSATKDGSRSRPRGSRSRSRMSLTPSSPCWRERRSTLLHECCWRSASCTTSTKVRRAWSLARRLVRS